MLVAISIFLILGFMSVLIRTSSAKSKKYEDESSKTFWDKEHEANFARKKDISNLPYIIIPIESLPFQVTEDSTINRYQDAIKTLAGKKLLNLSSQTNTELKLIYGAANLPFLMDCDTRYTELIKTLQFWGKALFDSSSPNEARIVLEFAVACKTDIAASYSLLGDIYASTNNTKQIETLLESAKEINSPHKNKIINYLENLLCK